MTRTWEAPETEKGRHKLNAVIERHEFISNEQKELIKRTIANKIAPSRQRGSLRGLTKEDLTLLYCDVKLSQWQIAYLVGVTQGAVFCWMRKWNIPARSHDDALLTLGKSGRFSGARNPKWAGGRTLSAGGYVLIRDPKHRRAQCRGYVLEHIAVWEQANGPLPPKWEVHHLNGIKTDNHLDNLEAMPGHKHKRLIASFHARIRQLETHIQELEAKHHVA